MATLSAGELRRNQIVEVASSLFESLGYHEASMDEIARHVGIAKASLYYHFDKKELILVEIHREMLDLLIGRQQARVNHFDGTWAEQLREFMSDIVSLMESHPGRLRIFFEAFRELPEDIGKRISAQRKQYRQMLVSLLESGIEAGEFSPHPPEVVSMAILGMCNWTYQWFIPGGRLTSREVADSFWNTVMSGLAPRGGHTSGPVS